MLTSRVKVEELSKMTLYLVDLTVKDLMYLIEAVEDNFGYKQANACPRFQDIYSKGTTMGKKEEYMEMHAKLKKAVEGLRLQYQENEHEMEHPAAKAAATEEEIAAAAASAAGWDGAFGD